MSSSELLSNPNFTTQSEHIYVVTDSTSKQPLEVFGSMEEVRDAYSGSSLSAPLAQIEDRIRAAQKLQLTITGSQMSRLQREYARLEASRTELADEMGLTPGSVESLQAERANTLSILPRSNAGTLWENDNYQGRSTGLAAVMPDAGMVNFDNIASSFRYSGVVLFSDLTWYRGSKLLFTSLTIQSIPSLGAYTTPHGVSWNDLISSWAVVSF